MALLPLVALAALSLLGRRRTAAWWWLGVAFAVSWVADSAAHRFDPVLVSRVYPVLQASIVLFALAPYADALVCALALALASMVPLLLQPASMVDVGLRTISFGCIAGVVFRLGRHHIAQLPLLIYFGGGLLAWYAYAIAPGWTTWGIYQATRAIGLTLFCIAACLAWTPAPEPIGRRSRAI